MLFIVFGFIFLFCMPVGNGDFMAAVHAALDLAKWYAQEHVLLCLVPAFFIAGVISVFVSKGAVLRFFGASAPKWLSYSIAAVSGGILAVCSCTILPLFTGIYKRGAGLGPAVAFLYSGPAISVLSIILTARILGVELGIARAVGAVGFSLVIGLVMAFIFRREKREKGVDVQNGEEDALPVGHPSWHSCICQLGCARQHLPIQVVHCRRTQFGVLLGADRVAASTRVVGGDFCLRCLSRPGVEYAIRLPGICGFALHGGRRRRFGCHAYL